MRPPAGPPAPYLPAAALPPFRPASRFCAVVPPCLAELPDPLFLPPRLEAPGELAILAARSFDMPLSLRASYCFSFLTLGRFPSGIVSPPLVASTCSDHDLPGPRGRRTTIEAADLEELGYTAHVIDETMRLYPAGHTLARCSTEPTVLGGHPVAAREIVGVSVWAIHHNPAVWPDPHRFDPDRFGRRKAEGGDREGGTPSRYAHLFFGGGPRACIGQYLAMAEMTVAVATVVRAFELEATVEEPPLDLGVSLLPADRLPCRLVRAGEGPPRPG